MSGPNAEEFLASILEGLLPEEPPAGIRSTREQRAASIASSVASLFHQKAQADNRRDMAGYLKVQDGDIPAEVWFDFIKAEWSYLENDATTDRRVRDVVEDLERDTIRHNYRKDGYEVYGAVNGHEMIRRPGESSAYADHSDACGCHYVAMGDEPWMPIGADGLL